MLSFDKTLAYLSGKTNNTAIRSPQAHVVGITGVTSEA